MKRKEHISLLKSFALAVGMLAGAGVAVAACPDASAALRRAPLPAALADSATFEWIDSTRINIRLLLGSGDVRITTDDRLILMPRIVSASGDSVYELPPVEFAGRRNKKYFDRRAALRRAETPHTVCSAQHEGGCRLRSGGVAHCCGNRRHIGI